MMLTTIIAQAKGRHCRCTLLLLAASAIPLQGCGGGGGSSSDEVSVSDESGDEETAGVVDITNRIFTESSRDCAGYSLKEGSRGTKTTDNPGGDYDGSYIDDWKYTDAEDLDECNGMMVNDQYAYYVTDSYPWMLACFKGAPDTSFNKN